MVYSIDVRNLKCLALLNPNLESEFQCINDGHVILTTSILFVSTTLYCHSNCIWTWSRSTVLYPL